MSSTIIDHAIAIPTRQRNVWDYISEIEKFPLWHVDVESISFISTKHSGRGTRYRTLTRKGATQIIEITAWYEGLGFEYVIVDGSSFENNRGRVRLQESTEGTIVQWTFSYELSGFLSGLRNSLSVRGSVDKTITDNLRNLYTHIKELRGEERFAPEDSKSYLQEAPDVVARSQYQPRYPSKSEPHLQPVPPTYQAPEAASKIYEPPLAQDDTKPNPSVQIESQENSEQLAEPTFLKDVPDFSKPQTEPRVPPQPLPRFERPDSETESVTVSAPTASDDSTAIVQPESAATPELQPRITQEIQPERTTPEKDPDAIYTGDLPGLPTAERTDTSKVSVFEVFGLSRPSETENLRGIQDKESRTPQFPNPVIEANTEQVAAFTDEEPIIPDVQPLASKRRGLRAALRRKETKVRLPK